MKLLDTVKFRIDAEYYKKRFNTIEKKLNMNAFDSIEDLNCSLNCSAFYPSITNNYNFNFEGIPFLRVNEIQNGFVKIDENTSFLPREILDQNNSTIAIGYPSDIIIAKGGNTLGKVGILPNNYPEYSLSRDLILIETKNMNNCSPYFLWAYLNSEIGQDMLIRLASQTGQPHLTLKSLEKMKIPRFNKLFEMLSKNLFEQSLNKRNESKTLYESAVNIVLSELNLVDFSTTNDKTSIKTLKDSFISNNRLDAEYYQNKYDEILEKIKGYGSWDFLGNVVVEIDTGEYSSKYYHQSSELVFYIRSVNMKESQIVIDEDYFVNPNDFTRIARKGHILTTRVGSIGTFSSVNKDLEGSVYSDNILGFKLPNNYIPEVYTLLFNTKHYFELVDRFARGSVQQRLNQETLKELVIPIIDDNVQKRAYSIIESSFSLKSQSYDLMKLLIDSIDLAIEQSEMIALDYINESLNKLGLLLEVEE